MTKAMRLFYIINYLSNHPTVTAEELAKNCGTSTRSIYRDMKDLEYMGFFYITEGQNGYRLIDQPTLPSNKLTSEEWISIVLFPLLSESIAAKEHPFHHTYRSAIEKVGGNVLDKNILSFSKQIGDRILYQDRYLENEKNNYMHEVIYAMFF